VVSGSALIVRPAVPAAGDRAESDRDQLHGDIFFRVARWSPSEKELSTGDRAALKEHAGRGGHGYVPEEP
jgi:hypothetical protein